MSEEYEGRPIPDNQFICTDCGEQLDVSQAKRIDEHGHHYCGCVKELQDD